MLRLLVAVLLAAPILALAQDPRLVEEPERYENGRIKRNAAVLREFQRLHPCPSTGAQSGACPGWERDHVIPLGECGADSISNLQWLPQEMHREKSKWDRRINKCAAVPMQITPAPTWPR